MAGPTVDPTWTLLLLLAFLAGLGALVWFFFHAELLEFLRYLRMVELAPLSLINARAAHCLTWVRLAPQGMQTPSYEFIKNVAAPCWGATHLLSLDLAKANEYHNLTGTSVGALARMTGQYYRWLLLAFCLYSAYYIIFKSDKNKFKTRHNLESFIKVQAKIWPVLEPFVRFNPAKHSARILGTAVPSKLPLFAEALSPEEWLSFHRIPVAGGIPDRERTRRALMLQLGPRWEGKFEGLPPYIMGLMAAFALKGVQKRDESDDFLGRLAVCWSKEKGFHPTTEVMAEIKKILKDPKVGGKALDVANKHAYRTTAVLGVLKWARFMGGVLASAQFLWLRGVDRDLWYAANNLGRRTFHSEGAGAMAHYMAEDVAQKALPVPRMETAIISINQYLASTQPTIPPHEDVVGAQV